MRQRKIKNIDKKLKLFGEPLVENPWDLRGRWREVFAGAGETHADCSGTKLQRPPHDTYKSGFCDHVQHDKREVSTQYDQCRHSVRTPKGSGSEAKSQNPSRASLYLEVGSGKGRFITESAAREPETLFIGFEGQESVLLRALQRAYVGVDIPTRELNDIAMSKISSQKRDEYNTKEPADCVNRTVIQGIARNPKHEMSELQHVCDGLRNESGVTKAPSHSLSSICVSHVNSGGEVVERNREQSSVAVREGDFTLPNLRFCSEYIMDMNDYFAEDELDGIFLNFSDPWPKARQEKRRLTSPRYLDGYSHALTGGGFICFKTDNDALFFYSVEQFDAHADFNIVAHTDDLHASEFTTSSIRTEYELRFTNLNKKIHYLEARRR